jgi:hypothetical protein
MDKNSQGVVIFVAAVFQVSSKYWLLLLLGEVGGATTNL